MRVNAKKYAGLLKLEAHEICNPHFKMRNPIYPGQGDFEKIPLRSFYGVAAATATILQRLFTVTIGQVFNQGGMNFTQTSLHTSMTKVNELPNPRKHLVREVALFLDNRMNQVDVVRFLSESLVTLIIGQKTFLQDLAGQIAGGGGAWNQSTFGSASVAGNAMPYSENCYRLTAPQSMYVEPSGLPSFPAVDGVVIEQGQNFRVEIDPTLAAQYAAVGFTTAAAAATPAGIGISAYLHLRGTQLIEVQ